MRYFAGLDVSLEETTVCIVDDGGLIVREARAASEPEALVAFFRGCGLVMERVGLEACSLTAWLHQGLTEAGIVAICIEARQAKAAMGRCRTRPIAMTRGGSPRSCAPAGIARCM
jgi:transposase